MRKETALKLLGLTGEYTEEELVRAYRSAAKKYHPDKTASSGRDTTQLFKEVKTAYEFLKRDASVAAVASGRVKPRVIRASHVTLFGVDIVLN